MIGIERIRNLYELGKELSFKDYQVVRKATTYKAFKANDFLIEKGNSERNLFFIKKGLVRYFQTNEKGEETTIGIVSEKSPLVSTDVILFNRPSQYYFQAIVPTETNVIDYDVLEEILKRNPSLERIRNKLLLNILQKTLERINSFVLLSPEKRYIAFVQENPEIANRIQDKYIANILGMTPVSLSRIRKRITQKSR